VTGVPPIPRRQAPKLALGDVRLQLSGRFTLRVDALEITAGVTVVRGPNGGGKSTLLRLLATALVADSGEYTVGGRSLHSHGSRSLDADRFAVRSSLGYLPQADSVSGRVRAFDHVDAIAIARALGANQRERHALVAEALAVVGLGHLASELCSKLSGGERRRVALAAALVGRPSLLIVDEPDAGLDDTQRTALAAELRRRGPDTSIVVATHDASWGDEIADFSLTVIGGDVRRI
jgi:ABC-2 type transport system ATP-binding protein